MRLIIILSILFLLAPFLCSGQTRIVIGKVIGEYEYAPIPYVEIKYQDTIIIGEADINGNFKIDLPKEKIQLTFNFIGMERTEVIVPPDCDNLEIVMMANVIYDFVTIQTINKKRYKRFKKLKDIHLTAFENGLFITKEPCVTYIFRKS